MESGGADNPLVGKLPALPVRNGAGRTQFLTPLSTGSWPVNRVHRLSDASEATRPRGRH